MNAKIKTLTTQQVKFLKKKFKPLKFNADFHLVYESQIPNTGIVLLDGQITFIHKRKKLPQVGKGLIFGIYEILNNIPSMHGCLVVGNSELIMIQKSDLIEAMEAKNCELFEIIKEHLA